jgi:hypothetical protein
MTDPASDVIRILVMGTDGVNPASRRRGVERISQI